ncbi:hypothetical protein MNBD_PLANCTO03-2232 [hydrothermal vent metagenome]|uniref:Uncharacterized protein n=1 Tax=hydrothermal vent metagenome TaxID=652676 RepID=A0A3B1D1H4_9ZZZZ
MSTIDRDAVESDGAGLEERGERTLAPAGPYRVVVVASPESIAWKFAFASGAGVLVLDPMRVSDAVLLGPLQPPTEGHAVMPRWAVYDCAEVPGAVISLLREPLDSPFEKPLDPLAFVLATPHAESGAWHLSCLTVRDTDESDGPDEPEDALQLRMVEAAMEVLRAAWVTMIVPWGSLLFDRLAERDGVEVLTARSLLHGPEPAATVQLRGTQAVRERAESSPAFHIPVQAGELSTMLDRLEAALEEGSRYLLAPPPHDDPAGPEGVRFVLCEVVP